LERLRRLRSRAETSPMNVLEAGTQDFGIIASGVAYEYAREAFPRAWFLKLGLSYPLPHRAVTRLFDAVSRVAVVEELDPFIEEQVRAMGLPVVGKEAIPANGELDPETVRLALEQMLRKPPPQRRRPVVPAEPRIEPAPPPPILPVRPPVLCAGCPHRAVFAMLRRRKVATLGDIGCYTLGALPPLLSLDSCLCMGASVGMMAGMNKALGRKAAVAVIGDSTFFHSGVTPLMDARYNEAEGLVIVLDNRTTAMTGHQGHPGTGRRADGSEGPALDIEQLCLGLGVRCRTVDAFEEEELERVLKAELAGPGLAVLAARGPCVLQTKPRSESVQVDAESCNLCGLCFELGCPALRVGDAAVAISADCSACGVCLAVCRRGALSLPGDDSGHGAEVSSP
jgi:indolepyruvate ferredoxin oxidoreductase alpha subunit